MVDLDCVHSEAGEHGLLVYFYLQAKDDEVKDMDTALGDDKHERSVTSDSVRVSEDVPRSQSNPVPKSPTQSHTSTDSTSEIGRYSCRHQQTEMVMIYVIHYQVLLTKESLSQKRVIQDNTCHTAPQILQQLVGIDVDTTNRKSTVINQLLLEMVLL